MPALRDLSDTAALAEAKRLSLVILARRDKLDAAIEPDHRELAVLFLPPRLAHAEHVLKQLHRSFHIRYRHGSMVKIRFHFFAPFDFTMHTFSPCAECPA